MDQFLWYRDFSLPYTLLISSSVSRRLVIPARNRIRADPDRAISQLPISAVSPVLALPPVVPGPLSIVVCVVPWYTNCVCPCGAAASACITFAGIIQRLKQISPATMLFFILVRLLN